MAPYEPIEIKLAQKDVRIQMALLFKEQINGNFYEMTFYSYNWLPKQTARQRGKREKLTTEAKKVINKMNSRNQLMRYLCLNFVSGTDLFVTLTYDEPEPTGKLAARRLSGFHAKMRAAFEKNQAGLKKRKRIEYKYIAVTETHGRDGEPVRIHHHLVLNRLPGADMLTLIQTCWSWGRFQAKTLIENDNYEDTASYFLKERKPIHKRKWTRSRNLTKPEPPIRTIRPEGEKGQIPPGVVIWESKEVGNEFGSFGYYMGRIVDLRAFKRYLRKREKYKKANRGKLPI